MHLRFCETESAFDYMLATREYIDKHGKPVAFYSDKHAVFRVSQAETRRTGITQFGRVLHDLNIELICANSSQAKGRVERANLTLQDRLIKEMRLENINSIEEANTWLDNSDGTLAFKYGYRTLTYQVFDKLAIVDQGAIVDNKRLGAVLKLAQTQQDERDRDGQRERSKRMPKRRAQARIQEQLRAINPVLANPEEFRASLKR